MQSARSVWRQRLCHRHRFRPRACCNLHGACGGKASERCVEHGRLRCNLHGACGGKGESIGIKLCAKNVAICTERVEAKHVGVSTPRRRLSCNLHGACGGKGGWKRKFLQRKRYEYINNMNCGEHRIRKQTEAKQKQKRANKSKRKQS